jgi:hypothetical protein
MESSLLSVTPLPPITTVLNPPAVLLLPALTLDDSPLAVLDSPLLTLRERLSSLKTDACRVTDHVASSRRFFLPMWKEPVR